MKLATFADLISEVLEGYEPPIRARTTCRMMRQTARELSADPRLRTPQDLSPAALWRWMKRHPGRSPITAAAHLRNIRTICNFAVGRGYLTSSPFAFDAKLKKAVSVRKDAKMRHHPLADIGRVLAFLRGRSAESWEWHRLLALAATVAYTGVRALEAQFAEVADFDLAEGFLRVEPKPKHPLKTESSERDVPIPSELSRILEGWLPLARSNWAFPGVKRLGPWTGGLNGYRPLDRLKQAGEAVGVEGFTFLSLRHSYITHGSGPWHLGAREIQQIAGHTLIDTQKHYLGRDRANLRSAVATIAFPCPPAASG